MKPIFLYKKLAQLNLYDLRGNKKKTCNYIFVNLLEKKLETQKRTVKTPHKLYS